MAFPIPAIGEDNSVADPKIRSGLGMLNAQIDMALGQSTSLLICPISDSIGGYLLGGQGSDLTYPSHSPFFWAQAMHYPADIVVNNGAPDAAAPLTSGYGYAAPGQTSAYILANMVPQLEAKVAAGARVPDIVVVSSGQNDGVTDLTKAQGTFANIRDTVNRLLALGVRKVPLFGLLPYPGIAAPDRPWALDWCNSSLRQFARDTAGVRFIDCLAIAKDVSGAPEALANPEVQWRKGVNAAGDIVGVGGRGGTGIDTAHPSTGFGFALAREVAQALRECAPVRPYPDIAPVVFSASRDPLGSYLGRRGLFLDGANGLGAGWSVDGVAGLTATPSLVTDDDGWVRQRITLSGTPTATGQVKLKTAMTADAPGGGYEMYGIADCVALDGATPPQLYGPRFSLGTADTSASIAAMLKGAFSGRMVFTTPRPWFFQNSGGSSQEFGCAIGVRAGVPVSGYVEFSRIAFKRAL